MSGLKEQTEGQQKVISISKDTFNAQREGKLQRTFLLRNVNL